jgi:type I restriction enzyme, S subunit
MSSKVAKHSVPKLQFPEFRGSCSWKDFGFVDLLDQVLDFRGRTPSKLGMTWGGGNVISLSANNVKNGYIDLEAECNLGSADLYEKWMGGVHLTQGDIVFTTEAPLGLALRIPGFQKYILSQRVIAFKTKSIFRNEFIIQLIWGSPFQRAIHKLATGSTAKGINQRSLKQVRVFIPNEIEQKKIADCLSSLDDLITAQAQKIEILKAHKKGLMQQLFPVEGESVPRLRFPEFQKESLWISREIGDVFTVTRGEVLSMSLVRAEWSQKAPFPVYSSQTKSNGRAGYYSNYLFEDAITWTTDGANAGDVNYRVGKFYCTNVCGVLVNTEGYANSCVAAMLNSVSKSHVSYVGNPKLMNGVMAKIKIAFPSVAEQRKIGRCLSSAETLLAEQVKALDELKTHKLGLMQGLFPFVDGASV